VLAAQYGEFGSGEPQAITIPSPLDRDPEVEQALHPGPLLLAHRSEERAALLVERGHPRVRALYERWGYDLFGEILPFADAPLYDALIKPLR
jgi:hypothetical protein